VKDQAGFIGNRCSSPTLNNAVRLLEQNVADRDGIDTAMKGGCGFPWDLRPGDLVAWTRSLAILDALTTSTG